MGKIKSHTEFICKLKNANIDISNFDYIDGKTKDSYLETHPFITKGRRYYNNPLFWTILFDSDLKDCIEYTYNMPEFYPDYQILVAFMLSNHKLANKYFHSLANYFFKSENIYKEKELDNLLLECSMANRLDCYQKLENIAIELDIKPMYGEYANAGNGYCLYHACKCNDGKFVDYLLEHNADVTLNDSMAFVVACRDNNYIIALKVYKRGADIHTKKDLAKKLLIRSFPLYNKLSEEEKTAYDELFNLYDKKEE